MKIMPKKGNDFMLDIHAEHYSRLVFFGKNLHEPPMTVGLTLDKLKRFKSPKLSNQNQMVERFIQEVSKESLNVSTIEKRNGNVLTTSFYREKINGRRIEDYEKDVQEIEQLRKQIKKTKEADIVGELILIDISDIIVNN